ncbi:P44/Msp2 family outer membrane protein [Anaplasma marginale]|uniref:P44/Msp2 family outer membrane protein n=1 Tax=Anaplasma marginale TaxID=770 RepID=UPI00030AA80E|nr:P44/Msp2 family outer membrane protein [Anaplasma marginale]
MSFGLLRCDGFFKLGGVVLRSLVGATLAVLLPAVFLYGTGSSAAEAFGPYVSFGYTPAWGGVRNLYVGIPGETWYVLPYKKDVSGDEVLSWSSFDWWGKNGGAPGDDPIKFKRISPYGVTGAVGYALGDTRIELGVIGQEFSVSEISGRHWKQGNSLFLLLGKRSADLVRWLRPYISTNAGDGKSVEEGKRLGNLLLALRRGLNGLSESGRKAEAASAKMLLNYVGSATMPGSNWSSKPDVVKRLHTMLGQALPKVWPYLSYSDKDEARRALGEYGDSGVVAISAVELTAVTVVGCRDLALSNLFTAAATRNLDAYGCAGMGVSFVRGAGKNVAEFGAELKLGVSYRLSRAASVFVGGVLHRTANYDFNLPVIPMGADSGSVAAGGHADYARNEARISFGVLNLAGEVGLRFILT